VLPLPLAAALQVLAQKQNMLNILSRTTGHSPEKLDKVLQPRGWYCCGTAMVL
jgi:DNA-binding phage protein